LYKGAESPPHEHIVMSKIFISYRRDDSAGYAHAVYSQLVQHFSKDQLFMDVDTVEPGVDFVRVIEEAVGECDVLVALIGKRWVGGESGGTSSRLDKEKDYVRLEVSTALARDIRVIPVLVDGMTMPSENILPAPLQPLTRRNAIEISNTRFNFDVERLIIAVRNILDEAEAQRKADEENRKRIEEERISAQRKAEQWHTVTDVLRKTEAEGLHEQERQRLEEEAGGKADDEKQERIHQEVPNLWRTYGPVAAAVAVVLILFSVFWWPKLQEAPIKEAKDQKEPTKASTAPVKGPAQLATKKATPPVVDTSSTFLSGTAKTAYFFDDFSGEKLNPYWKLLDPNPSKWTLQTSKSSLLIITERGSISGSSRNLKNQFLLDRSMPKGNYEVIAKTSFQIQGTLNSISIALFRDDDNFLELSYWGQPTSNVTFSDGAVYYDFYRTVSFVKEEGGQRNPLTGKQDKAVKGPSDSLQPLLLKIERDGHQFTGYYALFSPARPPQNIDDVSWVKIGTHALIDFDGKLSLWANNGNANIYRKGPPPEVAAEFDFVLVRER
jgi:TIR domain